MNLLDGIDADLRRLAQQLEADGLADAAAAVYYNLANLPQVDVVKNDVTGQVIRGYSRGFDPDSQRRLADRAHAWTLVRSRPAIEYVSRVVHLMGDLVGPATPERIESRRRYLDISEKYFRDYPEQMWPPFHLHVWATYGALGDADRACDALRVFAEFEPSYYPPEGWLKQLGYYEADVKLFGSKPTRKCELPVRSRGGD